VVKFTNYIKIFYIIFSLFVVKDSTAQMPEKLSSGDIYTGIEKLNMLGSVLYVAAHPDDENTRVISYLANDRKAYTTYLSLTRGDGGQNLIGSEVSELLGALRTQELLMARSVDHGHQMFTRANDFGYSKNAEETIRIWDTEKIKADVVWAMRKTRPDVIINRFDHRTSGETHGHHTASAMLSLEMFDQVNDATKFPSHFTVDKSIKPWQPRRIFFNTSWWFYGSEEKFKNADKSKLMSLDVGSYYPLIGKSNTEIAAESRSNHKCQGFGSTGTRGTSIEYLELLKGDLPPGKSDVFEGINTSWSRITGAQHITALVNDALKKFDFKDPSMSVPSLINIYKEIQKLDDDFWKPRKLNEIKELIAACAGLYLEAKTNNHRLVNGESIVVDIEAVNRSKYPMTLQAVSGINLNIDTIMAKPLAHNEPYKWVKASQVAQNAPLTAPYWLTKKHELGVYNVSDESMIGTPATDRALKATFKLLIDDVIIDYEKDIVYKFNSPENGETYRPLEIVPVITVKSAEPVYIFDSNSPRDVTVTVHSWDKNQSGKVTLALPKGWKCEPSYVDFTIAAKGESKTIIFKVYPPQGGDEITIQPIVTQGDKSYSNKLIDIPYDHIPYQTVLLPSEIKLSKIDIKIANNRIAYIAGAGDEIPSSLRQIGYNVTVIKADEISKDVLLKYNALVIGVRAYNTEEPLKFKQKEILEYVNEGGTVVIQYNTSGGLVTKDLGPYPIGLSRSRVTVEDAEMRITNPTHSILNYPNKITSKDFEGWVQERGLYFPGEWDPKYETILSCNDPGEKPLESSVLAVKYGDGHYIYTGLSFFRELPAGVSGAFRLFANMISYGGESAKP
jgi:LmbE family N-acetylglucosaminyl deacetylase